MLDGLCAGLRARLSLGRARMAGKGPAAGPLHAKGDGAAPTPPGSRAATIRGHEQRPQPDKAVRIHEAEGDKLGQRLLDLGPQQPARLDQLVKERGTMSANGIEDGLR